MFRCCRPKESVKPAPTKISIGNVGESTNALEQPNDSTSALLESIIPIVLPIVRRAVSKSLIESGSILRDEEPIEKFDESSPDDDLPIGPIRLQIESISVMDINTVMKDMKKAPNFKWPEKDNVQELMANKPGAGREMIVFDFIGLDMVIPLGPGIEYTLPAQLPMGIKTNIEIGCGGSIKEASVRMYLPKVRIWFCNKTRKLYVAVMEIPQFVPNIHVNADRGNGDFLHFEFKEEGELDNVVEMMLAGFGPGFEKKPSKTKLKKKKQWVGDVIGKQLSYLLDKIGGSGGNAHALEIDLSTAIQSSIDAAFGKPRPVDEIKVDIARLEKELELSMKLKDEARQEESKSNGSNAAVVSSTMKRSL